MRPSWREFVITKPSDLSRPSFRANTCYWFQLNSARDIKRNNLTPATLPHPPRFNWMKFPHKRKVQHTFRYSAAAAASAVPLLTDCAACLGPGHGPQSRPRPWQWQWPCPGRCRGMLPVRELRALKLCSAQHSSSSLLPTCACSVARPRAST